MRTNNKVERPKAFTYEGGPASNNQTAEKELQRTVFNCLLYEDTFYEKGSDIAERIKKLCTQVSPQFIGTLAVTARNELNLRHVPLFLARQLARVNGKMTAEVLEVIIQRPDEMAEFLAIYWKDNGRKTLSAGVKRGLANSFNYFNEYQLAKWNRDNEVKLRDVLFLCHAKPKNKEQATVWQKLIDGTLETPDTWEVALSSGADKKETWERLLRERKLGQMALLMNLRNMDQAGVDTKLVNRVLIGTEGKALPFRFVSAAKAAPKYAQALSDAMLSSIPDDFGLLGYTNVIIDVSGSMDAPISNRGTLNRMEAAGALAVFIREICKDVSIYTFSTDVKEVANYRGLSLVNGIINSQGHGGTELGKAITKLQNKNTPNRVIVITDEQSSDKLPRATAKHSYIINVAPYKPASPTEENGWTRISGFSERILDWIHLNES